MKTRFLEIVLLLIGAILIIFFVGTQPPVPETSESGASDTLRMQVPMMRYGIRLDSMVERRERIRTNQFLSDILLEYGVSYAMIDELVRKSRPVFDVRKMRAGNYYSAICSADSLRKLCYFIYESGPTSYIVYDLRDSIHIHRGEKEIEVRRTSASGTISTSLWNAMVDGNTDPNLANELSEIYAWAIDFFGLQKGDSYRVIYEELVVEDEYIGIGKVQAALFRHAGKDFYAFYFVQDSIGDYFDEEANSMRRTFLKAPLRFNRISSRFSYSRLHPILKIRRPHLGVDYAAPTGTPVHAVGDGKVIFAARKGANGNLIKIRHNGTYTTAYLHLSGFAKGIRSGVYVKQGDVIGYVGSTGMSTGPHLDFRFYRNGQPVDPLKVESPPAEPVADKYRQDFFMHADTLMQELNGADQETAGIMDFTGRSER